MKRSKGYLERRRAKKKIYDKTYAPKKRTRIRARIKLIKDEAGGACKICGYNKNYAALTFHHAHGDKNIGMNDIYRMKIEDIRKEARKCVLFCANCHLEMHNPELEK